MGEEPLFCMFSGMYCKTQGCPAFSLELDNCKVYVLLDNLLGEVSVAPIPVSMGMTGLPDVSGVQWFVGKGQDRYDARPTDDKAWAFVYKYDTQARQATDIVRDECRGLVDYLGTHPSLEIGEFKYALSGKDKSFLNRNRIK